MHRGHSVWLANVVVPVGAVKVTVNSHPHPTLWKGRQFTSYMIRFLLHFHEDDVYSEMSASRNWIRPRSPFSDCRNDSRSTGDFPEKWCNGFEYNTRLLNHVKRVSHFLRMRMQSEHDVNLTSQLCFRCEYSLHSSTLANNRCEFVTSLFASHSHS